MCETGGVGVLALERFEDGICVEGGGVMLPLVASSTRAACALLTAAVSCARSACGGSGVVGRLISGGAINESSGSCDICESILDRAKHRAHERRNAVVDDQAQFMCCVASGCCKVGGLVRLVAGQYARRGRGDQAER